MNHTLAPAWGADVGGGHVSPAAVLAIGLVAVLLLLALGVLVVAILAVVLKSSDQRADGIRVLEQLGQMLAKVLDTFLHSRRQRPSPDAYRDDVDPAHRDEENVSH